MPHSSWSALPVRSRRSEKYVFSDKTLAGLAGIERFAVKNVIEFPSCFLAGYGRNRQFLRLTSLSLTHFIFYFIPLHSLSASLSHTRSLSLSLPRFLYTVGNATSGSAGPLSHTGQCSVEECHRYWNLRSNFDGKHDKKKHCLLTADSFPSYSSTDRLENCVDLLPGELTHTNLLTRPWRSQRCRHLPFEHERRSAWHAEELL